MTRRWVEGRIEGERGAKPVMVVVVVILMVMVI